MKSDGSRAGSEEKWQQRTNHSWDISACGKVLIGSCNARSPSSAPRSLSNRKWIPNKMDACSERSVPYLLDEAVAGYLEEHRFPRAEACVVCAAAGGCLATCGLVLIGLHYTLETRPGFHSLLSEIASPPLLGLLLLLLAALLPLGALLTYVSWRVTRVLDMAHRFRQLCAYEEVRQSVRSRRGDSTPHLYPTK
ncbi:uncharacterized protein NPIL_379131 [Nephila pilipes]|uniref:Uncharacterized protein n=1 Tax=Nephila pilipes TaxID=299642 RepID=A0A8X6T8X1_NEPPI|nr:uncharacterized protein NPIL_379131 [Nephila pilipes]